MNDLSQSSFFDLSIYLKFYGFTKVYGILSEKAFPLTCIHFYIKVGEKITGGGVYTAGYDLLARTPSTHQLADNKLVSFVFFPMISFVSASKNSFDFMSS